MDSALALGIKPVQFEVIQWHPTEAFGDLFHPVHRDILPKTLHKWWERALLMAGSKADDLETKVLNAVLGAVAYTAVTPVFFGLWGTAGSIADSFTGGTAGEVASAGAYDRVSVVNNTTNFASVGANAAKVNSTAIVFPTASANWNAAANINQVGLLTANAKTSADLGMLWGDLTVPKPVLNGDTAQFAASAFSWTED